MNRALDACHKAGIGLISMKQVAGNTDLEKIGKELPDLQEKGLSPYQGLLHAIWTDERFASCCVSMRNTDQVRENAEAARVFKPLTKAELKRLRDACIAAAPTLCAGCAGQCSLAAGTTAELGNLTRFLTYHDHHGYRGEARRLYGELIRRRPQLGRRRPRSRPARLPQQARLRQAIAEGRSGSWVKQAAKTAMFSSGRPHLAVGRFVFRTRAGGHRSLGFQSKSPIQLSTTTGSS